MAEWPGLPTGFKLPLVDEGTDRLPDPTMEAIASSPELSATTDTRVATGTQLPLPNFGGYLQTLSALRSGDPVTVMAAIPDAQKSAILDGTTTYNATAAIQDILDDDGAASNAHIEYPRGIFRHGNLQVRDKETFKLIGRGARIVLEGDGSGINGVGFQLADTVEDVDIAGFHIVGDGDKSHKHAGVWGNSGATLRDIRIHHMLIEAVRVGISLNANSGGSIDGFSVTDNVLRDIVGIASGEGYGIHTAAQNASETRGLIARNRIYRAGRHAIYVARNSDVDVFGNMIFGHRAALTAPEIADATDGRGKTRAAIYVARSHHIRVGYNWMADGFDCALHLLPSAEGVGDELYDVSVFENHFLRPKDGIPMLITASTGPATTGVPQDVRVEANDFYADFDTISAGSVAAIQHNAGKGVTYARNNIVIKGVDQTTQAFDIFNRQDGSAGNTYNDDLFITDNTARMTTSNGSLCRVMRLDSTALTSAAKITVHGNEGAGDCIPNPAPLVAAVTNPNLRIRARDGGCVGLYAAGDTTPSVARGVTYLVVANTDAVSITNLDDGVDGQEVTLTFSDSNTTLVNSTSVRLASGTNYVGANRRTITLKFRNNEWREVSRANN